MTTPADVSRGGGGGRVAIVATDRTDPTDLSDLIIEVRGGRSLAGRARTTSMAARERSICASRASTRHRIVTMRDSEFLEWLEQTYVTPVGSRMQLHARQARVSNCRRVEEYLGDLDQHWRRDRLENVLNLLTFSRSDSAPKHNIPIDGNPYTGTATLRAAARLYAQFCDGIAPGRRISVAPRTTSVKGPIDPPAPIARLLQDVPTTTLLERFSAILHELKERGVMRTGNNPVADYAERLVAKALDLELLGNSTTGHDAVDAGGTRYEIKARRVQPGTKSHQLSAIRKLDAHHFDFLVAVLFTADFRVERALLIPYDIVQATATYVPHTNAWTLIVRSSLWENSAVSDLTDDVAAAAM